MSGNSSFSNFNFMYHCHEYQTISFLSIAFMVSKSLTSVPLSVLILALGYRRWQQQRSFQTTSHTDIFTYNAAAFGLTYGLAVIFFLSGFGTQVAWVVKVGINASRVVYIGEILLHAMTCAERYLAVVHPVFYLGLRQASGLRIRNICIGCVWLISFGWLGVTTYLYPVIPVIGYFCLLTSSLLIVSFCSLSVLCVLIRQRPGEVSRLRERADKSKKKAFHTMTAILSVLVVFFVASIFGLAVRHSNLFNDYEECLALICTNWFGFPSHLVLPLLFLQRAKILRCCYCSKKMKAALNISCCT